MRPAQATVSPRARAAGIVALALVVGACFGGFDGAPPKAGTAQGSASGSGDAKGGGDQAKKQGNKPPPQTYKQAWTLICQAEKRSGASGADRAARGAEVAAWIVRHLTNKRARYWFIAFGRAKEHEREPLFLAEAQRAGIKDCALRELLFGGDKGKGKGKAPASAPSSAPTKK